MELILTEEQRILSESAGKLVASLRAEGTKPKPVDQGGWRRIAEAGWLAIDVPEVAGGLGLGATELALVMEAAGRGLIQEPVGAVAVAAGVLARANQAVEVLETLLGGESVVLPVLGHGIETAGSGENLRLSGTVQGVAAADSYLVTTVVGFLCLADHGETGLAHRAAWTVDGANTGTLSFLNSPARLIASGELAAELASRMTDRVLLATGAELLGVMERALEMALDYVKTRRQFDRPIGSFQAIQHRAVTDYREVELTRSLLYQVCAAVDAGHAGAGLAQAVKAKASAAALHVTKSAIQMHGAIGYTDDLAVGWHLKRAMTLAACYGNADAQRVRYAELTGLA